MSKFMCDFKEVGHRLPFTLLSVISLTVVSKIHVSVTHIILHNCYSHCVLISSPVVTYLPWRSKRDMWEMFSCLLSNLLLPSILDISALTCLDSSFCSGYYSVFLKLSQLHPHVAGYNREMKCATMTNGNHLTLHYPNHPKKKAGNYNYWLPIGL